MEKKTIRGINQYSQTSRSALTAGGTLISATSRPTNCLVVTQVNFFTLLVALACKNCLRQCHKDSKDFLCSVDSVTTLQHDFRGLQKNIEVIQLLKEKRSASMSPNSAMRSQRQQEEDFKKQASNQRLIPRQSQNIQVLTLQRIESQKSEDQLEPDQREIVKSEADVKSRNHPLVDVADKTQTQFGIQPLKQVLPQPAVTQEEQSASLQRKVEQLVQDQTPESARVSQRVNDVSQSALQMSVTNNDTALLGSLTVTESQITQNQKNNDRRQKSTPQFNQSLAHSQLEQNQNDGSSNKIATPTVNEQTNNSDIGKHQALSLMCTDNFRVSQISEIHQVEHANQQLTSESNLGQSQIRGPIYFIDPNKRQASMHENNIELKQTNSDTSQAQLTQSEKDEFGKSITQPQMTVQIGRPDLNTTKVGKKKGKKKKKKKSSNVSMTQYVDESYYVDPIGTESTPGENQSQKSTQSYPRLPSQISYSDVKQGSEMKAQEDDKGPYFESLRIFIDSLWTHHDLDLDGFLDMEESQNFYHDLVHTLGQKLGLNHNEQALWYIHADIDQDEMISKEDMFEYLISIEYQPHDRLVNTEFDLRILRRFIDYLYFLYDSDQDDQLIFSETKNLFIQLSEDKHELQLNSDNHRVWFEIVDSNMDKLISKEELSTYFKTVQYNGYTNQDRISDTLLQKLVSYSQMVSFVDYQWNLADIQSDDVLRLHQSKIVFADIVRSHRVQGLHYSNHEEWFQTLDKHNQGGISKHSITMYLLEHIDIWDPFAQKLAGQINDFYIKIYAEHLWEKYDLSKGVYLDQKTAEVIFFDMTQTLTIEDLDVQDFQQWFSKVDVVNEGNVTKEQMVAHLLSIQEQLKELDKQEYIRTFVEELVRYCDQDLDGVLNFSETSQIFNDIYKNRAALGFTGQLSHANWFKSLDTRKQGFINADQLFDYFKKIDFLGKVQTERSSISQTVKSNLQSNKQDKTELNSHQFLLDDETMKHSIEPDTKRNQESQFLQNQTSFDHNVPQPHSYVDKEGKLGVQEEQVGRFLTETTAVTQFVQAQAQEQPKYMPPQRRFKKMLELKTSSQEIPTTTAHNFKVRSPSTEKMPSQRSQLPQIVNNSGSPLVPTNHSYLGQRQVTPPRMNQQLNKVGKPKIAPKLPLPNLNASQQLNNSQPQMRPHSQQSMLEMNGEYTATQHTRGFGQASSLSHGPSSVISRGIQNNQHKQIKHERAAHHQIPTSNHNQEHQKHKIQDKHHSLPHAHLKSNQSPNLDKRINSLTPQNLSKISNPNQNTYPNHKNQLPQNESLELSHNMLVQENIHNDSDDLIDFELNELANGVKGLHLTEMKANILTETSNDEQHANFTPPLMQSTQIKGNASASATIKPLSDHCKQHRNQIIKYFCKNQECSKGICPECIIFHSKHDFVLVSEAIAYDVKQIVKQANGSCKSQVIFSKQAKKYSEKRFAKLNEAKSKELNQLAAFFLELHKALNEREAQLTNLFNDQIRETEERLMKDMLTIQDHFNECVKLNKQLKMFMDQQIASTHAAVIGSSDTAYIFVKKVKELDHMSQSIKQHTNPHEEESERDFSMPFFRLNSADTVEGLLKLGEMEIPSYTNDKHQITIKTFYHDRQRNVQSPSLHNHQYKPDSSSHNTHHYHSLQEDKIRSNPLRQSKTGILEEGTQTDIHLQLRQGHHENHSLAQVGTTAIQRSRTNLPIHNSLTRNSIDTPEFEQNQHHPHHNKSMHWLRWDSNEIYKYDLETKHWVQRHDVKSASNFLFFSNLVHLPNSQGCFILGGADSQNNFSKRVQYFCKYNVFVEKPPMINKRAFFTSTYFKLDNSIIAIGGRDSNSSDLNKCERFSLLENVWRPISPLNISRNGAAAVTFDHHRLIFVFGGNNLKLGSMITIEKYEIDFDKWTVINTQMKIPLHDLSAFPVSRDRVLILGGYSNQEPHKDIEMVDLCFECFKSRSGAKPFALKQGGKCFYPPAFDSETAKMTIALGYGDTEPAVEEIDIKDLLI